MTKRVTELLADYSKGDAKALNDLWPLIYAELHRMAKRHLGGKTNATLQPTALLNEAYLKFADSPGGEFPDRVHFLALASRVMRNYLIDYARGNKAQKRGGNNRRVTFHEDLSLSEAGSKDLLRLDGVLKHLATENERAARVVELKYFGGMTFEEISLVLSISVATAKRDWLLAKTWLFHELQKTE